MNIHSIIYYTRITILLILRWYYRLSVLLLLQIISVIVTADHQCYCYCRSSVLLLLQIVSVMILNIISSIIFCWSLLGYSAGGLVLTSLANCSPSYYFGISYSYHAPCNTNVRVSPYILNICYSNSIHHYITIQYINCFIL